MVERTITINDTLLETIDGIKHEIIDLVLDYLTDNTVDNFDEISDEIDVFELVDGWIPVYNGEIRDLWYLYSSDFEDAIEQAGVEIDKANYQQQAIFYYYVQEALNILNNLKDIFDDNIDQGQDIVIEKISEERNKD